MRLKLFLASIITALLTASLSSVALAGGPDATNLDLTPSAATAIADNSATITFSLFSYEYLCSGSSQTNVTSHDASGCTAQGYPNATKEAVCYNVPEDISVSGSGNTLSATSVIPDPNGTCKTSFTLKSSAAGTKTVHVQNQFWPTEEFTDATVTFTAPPTKPAPAPSAPATHTTTTAPSTPKPPASPSLDTLKVGNEQQTENAADTSSTTTVKQGQPLVLSGKTVPNGVVTLTIHSTPRTVTTTADKDGNWSYTVTGLPAGNHYVEASVTDPATKQTSQTTKLLAFTVTALKKPVSAPATVQPVTTVKHSNTGLYLGALAALIVLVAGSWFGRKLWRKKHTGDTPLPPQSPTDTTASPPQV